LRPIFVAAAAAVVVAVVAAVAVADCWPTDAHVSVKVVVGIRA